MINTINSFRSELGRGFYRAQCPLLWPCCRRGRFPGLLALKAASETLCADADEEYRKVEAVISDLETEAVGEPSRAALLRTEINPSGPN